MNHLQDYLQMTGIMKHGDTQRLRSSEIQLQRIRQMTKHVTAHAQLFRELAVSLDLVEERGGIEPKQIGQQIEASAMGHASAPSRPYRLTCVNRLAMN